MSVDKINSLCQTKADLHGVTHFTCSLLFHFCLILWHKYSTIGVYFNRKKKSTEGQRKTLVKIKLDKTLVQCNVDLLQGEAKGKMQKPDGITST